MKYLIYSLGGGMIFFIGQLVVGSILNQCLSIHDFGVALLVGGQLLLAILVLCVGIHVCHRVNQLRGEKIETKENNENEEH